MARRLTSPAYLAFPLRIRAGGADVDSRVSHIRGQIEQVLFTNPGERVHRADFGAGVKALVFEPNASAMWQVTKKRLLASLAEALRGEVDPKSIDVQVTGEEATLTIVVSYELAALGVREQQSFTAGA